MCEKNANSRLCTCFRDYFLLSASECEYREIKLDDRNVFRWFWNMQIAIYSNWRGVHRSYSVFVQDIACWGPLHKHNHCNYLPAVSLITCLHLPSVQLPLYQLKKTTEFTAILKFQVQGDTNRFQIKIAAIQMLETIRCFRGLSSSTRRTKSFAAWTITTQFIALDTY